MERKDMTSKERIITALKNMQPDAVPVTLGLSEMVPVRKSGLTYIEYFWREKRDLIIDRTDTEKDFGADVFLHSMEEPSPYDPEMTVEAVSESEDEVIYREVIHTKAGDLASLKKVTRTESIAIIEGFVDDPEADRDKVLELLRNPESKSWDKYAAHHEYVGDSGHCGLWLPTPFDWWSIMRRSPENSVYDLYDHSECIKDIFSEYTRFAVAMLRSFLENYAHIADSIGLGGSTTSMSVISPALLEEYTSDFIRAVKAVAVRYNVPVQYHMCGKSRAAIPILVEAGVDGVDALECPPTGTVDLGEVKRLFGDKISLRGNVNSITVMLQGKPDDVERDVVRCMEDAKEGGGFILGVGDQTPYWTPDENIYAMVEAGRRYGNY